MDSKTYLAESGRTAKKIEENRTIHQNRIAELISMAGTAGVLCDGMKRHEFYDDTKVAEKIAESLKNVNTLVESMYENENGVSFTPQQMDILHGVLGVFSEGAEILEALMKCVSSESDLDKVNIVEEVGDVAWYLALMLRAVDGTFNMAMEKNINKLKIRFPNEFSTKDALERNLDQERKVLEK